jgi:predicted RNA polymerase sigma factor
MSRHDRPFASDAQRVRMALAAFERLEYPKLGTKTRFCTDGTVTLELLRRLDAVKNAVNRLRRAVQFAKNEAERLETAQDTPGDGPGDQVVTGAKTRPGRL